MSKIKYLIHTNESISRWLTTNVTSEPYNSPKETFKANINSGEGYVQIIYPVRKAFLKQHDLKKVQRYNNKYDNIYFPFENNRVDFSTFIHTPHIMRVNAKTNIEIEDSKHYSFDIYTCGAIKIWIDKKVVMEFSPFTRNIASKKRLDIFLKKGIHEIEVYAKELAERDVFFYFEIRNINKETIIGNLPFEGDAKKLNNLETWLKSCFFRKDVYKEGDVKLEFSSIPFKHNLELFLKIEDIESHNIFNKDNTNFNINKKDTTLTIVNVKDIKTGVYKIQVGAKISNHTIYRTLLVAIRPPLAIENNPSITEIKRKKQASNYIIENGEDTITKALLMIEKEKHVSKECEKYILNSLEKINKKEDCADFVYSPMLILIYKYKSNLSNQLYDKIHKEIINFRFWIDEPGNDVMWYFSENHALLFHTAQYLAGQLYPDEIFTLSNRLGKNQKEIGKKRLIKWFEEFFNYGFAEWNSATYIPIDLIGFFTLFELAKDNEIKNYAKKALDSVFELIAYSSYNGILSTSYGRCYEKTLKSREQVETSFISWIAFMQGYIGRRTQAVPLYCISEYTPTIDINNYNPRENERITFKQSQGKDKVNIYSYKTPDYFISCVQAFNPYKHGHQQHIMNITLDKECEQFYINNPGERAFSGENRPSYWAGNGTNPFVIQEKNNMLMLFKIDKNELVHAIHAYLLKENYDQIIENNKYLFLRKKNSYLALWFSNDYVFTTEGANTNKELIAKGLNQGIVLKCGSKSEYEDFKTFIAKFKKSQINYDEKSSSIFFKSWDSPSLQIIEKKAYIDEKVTTFDYGYSLSIEKEILC